jgi:hypothetical protein
VIRTAELFWETLNDAAERNISLDGPELMRKRRTKGKKRKALGRAAPYL